MCGWKKFAIFFVLIVSSACSVNSPETTVELSHYPLDDIEDIISQSMVNLDQKISADGKGSLRITTDKPVTIRLFETGDIDIENVRLFYSAKIQTKNLEGKVYLEIWCHFKGLGEYFSRALDQPLSGTTAWVSQETPFFLQKEQNPDNIKLNLVIDGKGTVWIDDIRLTNAAL